MKKLINAVDNVVTDALAGVAAAHPSLHVDIENKVITRAGGATEGKVGYIHIPDMGAAGIREFIKYYYPQIRKEGMVVDVRGNGGGSERERARSLCKPSARRTTSTGDSSSTRQLSVWAVPAKRPLMRRCPRPSGCRSPGAPTSASTSCGTTRRGRTSMIS